MLSAKDRQAVMRCQVDKERLLSLAVTAFIRNRGLSLPDGLAGKWVPDDELLPLFSTMDSLEDVIWLFGCGLSTDRVRSEGAVYTPSPIRSFIVNRVIDSLEADDQVADLSCGCGAFLLTLVESMRKRFPDQSLSCLFDRIHGVDIDETAIRQAKVLCLLYASTLGKDIDASCLHLSVRNALSLPSDLRFKVIIGNPPYVRLRNLPKEQVGLLGDAKGVGLTDMYLVFFQLSLDHLEEGGVACLIAPNTWLTSLNGRGFRERLLAMRIAVDLFDFGSKQVFPARTTYTCIVRMGKVISDALRYTNVSPLSLDQECVLEPYAYDGLSADGWRLSVGRDRLFLDRVSQMAVPLLDGLIYSNGIATCANDVFIFKPERTLKKVFEFKDRYGRVCKVERAICKPLVRCADLCAIGDYESVCQQIIFPYKEGTVPLDESVLRRKFPLAYAYLLFHREQLLGRDKGVLSYPWYAWGRTQGFRYINQSRLVMPMMSGLPVKAFLLERECFIVNGFALVSSNLELLRMVRSILSSKVFGHFLELTSKPYRGDFWALMRTSIKGFRLPVFNGDQQQILIDGNPLLIDRLLAELYDAKWLLDGGKRASKALIQ